jgi:hypothetical protein
MRSQVDFGTCALAPAVEGASGGQVVEPEITREIAAQYFSGAYSRYRTAWHRLRRVVDMLRVAVLVFGIAICAAAVYVTWRETGTSDLNALYSALGQRSFVLFTGALIALIGAVPLVWRYGWQLPVGVFALGMAVEMTLLDLGYRPVAIGMFLVAMGAIIYSYFAPRTRQPLEDRELEEKLDRWIEAVTKKVVSRTEVPSGGRLGEQDGQVLKSFPKRERIGTIEVLCKIGQDSRPRVTPMGVAMFELRPATMVVFEGAVDLQSEAVLYARVHEFRYEDIIALLWSRDAVAAARPALQGSPLPGRSAMQAVAGKGKADEAGGLRHRETLEIRLSSGRSVSLVFNDTEFLPAENVKMGVKLIEDMDHIRQLWQEILARQGKARLGSARAGGGS